MTEGATQSRRRSGRPGRKRALRRLLETPLWRPLPVALAAVVGLAAGLGLARTEVPRYRSSVSVAVELERRPGSVGTSVGTERVRRRLPDIRRSLTQVEVLEDVLRAVDDVEAPVTTEIERMREAFTLQSEEGNILRLEYVDGDPGRAAAVANGLAAHLVDQAESQPADPPAVDTEALGAEMAVVRGQMDELVGDIERLQAREAAPASPNADLAALKQLEDEHRALVLSHQRKLAELDALRSQPPPAASAPAAAPDLPNQELIRLRDELAALRARYTDEHPDVEALRRQIARLEAAETGVTPAPAPGPPVETGEQIRLAEELTALSEQRAQLESRMARLASVPVSPDRGEPSLLERRYAELQDRYGTLEQEREKALQGEVRARSQSSARFHVLDAARPPETPYFPSFALFAAAGTLFGLLAGALGVMAAEGLAPSITTPEDVEEILGSSLLAEIPMTRAGGPLRRLVQSVAHRATGRGAPTRGGTSGPG